MKIITKKIPIEELILNVKTNYKNPEKYFLLSTKEMYPPIEQWFNEYCPNLKSVTLNCFEEQVPKEFSYPLIIIEIDKKFVKKEELEKFTQMEKELFQIILAPNKLEYDNEDDINWFVRKILDVNLNNDNFIPKNKDNDFYIDNDVIGISPIKYEFTVRACAAPFYEKGQDLQDKGEHLESLNFFKIAHQLDKTHFSYFSLARCYFYLKKYSKSIDHAKESLKLNNKNETVRILLSHDFFNEGNYEKALRELENIDRTNLRFRDIVEVELQLAKVNMTLGYEKKSISHFKNAEQITPEKYRPYLLNQILFEQFSFYREVDDYQKCSEILKILILRFPSNPKYLTKIGSYKFRLNELVAAEKYLLESLNLDRNNHETMMYLFSVYLQQRKFSKALEFSKKLIKIKDKFNLETFERLSNVIKMIPQLVEKEKTMQLEDVLNQINSKDKDVESFEQYHLKVTEQLKKKSNTSISNFEEFPTVSYEQLRKTDIECLEIMREFIRKKYSGNINFLKDDKSLFSNGHNGKKPFGNYIYTKIEDTLKNRNNTMIKQKPINDLFDCLDFSDFPYIFRKKNLIWETQPDLISRLSILVSNRNTPAHHSGPDNLGNLDPVDSNQHFFTCIQTIRHIQEKMKI
jgi:tetratricopeptide (TPR) repeat protein